MIRPVPRGAHFAIRAARNGAYIIRKPDRALHFTQTAFKELYFWIDRSYLLVLRSLMAKEENKKTREEISQKDRLPRGSFIIVNSFDTPQKIGKHIIYNLY